MHKLWAMKMFSKNYSDSFRCGRYSNSRATKIPTNLVMLDWGRREIHDYAYQLEYFDVNIAYSSDYYIHSEWGRAVQGEICHLSNIWINQIWEDERTPLSLNTILQFWISRLHRCERNCQSGVTHNDNRAADTTHLTSKVGVEETCEIFMQTTSPHW